MQLLLVMIGGALGAGARHLAGRAALALMGPGYPWGTLFVNLLGGALMGLLAGGLARASGAGVGTGEPWRLFLGVGVLGGFTTFSAFALDTVLLWQRGEAAAAAGYVLLSVAGAVGGIFAGLAIARGTMGGAA